MKKILARWFDFSKSEDRLKFIILASGILIILIVGMTTTLSLTNQPSFCSACHKTMTPEYATWQVTSHSQIACTNCHIKPGVVNTLLHKVKTLKEPVEYFTGTYPKPIEPTEKIDNENCLQCHSTNRIYTLSGDLIVPHDRHIKAGIKCVDCHYGVAHGKIYERGLTGAKAKVSPEQWTTKYAEEVTADFTKPDMDTCIQCHIKKGKPISCETCHKSLSTPENHRTDKWIGQHGLEAEKDIQWCTKCHNFGFKNNNINIDNKTIAYAWGNSFCANCHSKLPAGHNNNVWRNEHPQKVAQKGMKNCLACHRINESLPKLAPAKVECIQCHFNLK